MKKIVQVSILVTTMSLMMMSCGHFGGHKHASCHCGKEKPCAVESKTDSKEGKKADCEDCKKGK